MASTPCSTLQQQATFESAGLEALVPLTVKGLAGAYQRSGEIPSLFFNSTTMRGLTGRTTRWYRSPNPRIQGA
jgi:hypothetical protein